MPTFTFYDLTTGALTGRTFRGPADMVQANAPEGCGWIEGEFDVRARRVVDGIAVEWKPPQPPDTDHWTHEWTDGRWVRVPGIALARRRAREMLMARIAAEEAGQMRPLRELLLAQANGTKAPDALARLRAGDESVLIMRQQLQAIDTMNRAALARIGQKP